MITNWNGNEARAAASCAPTSYCGVLPVPLSPITAKRTMSSAPASSPVAAGHAATRAVRAKTAIDGRMTSPRPGRRRRIGGRAPVLVFGCGREVGRQRAAHAFDAVPVITVARRDDTAVAKGVDPPAAFRVAGHVDTERGRWIRRQDVMCMSEHGASSSRRIKGTIRASVRSDGASTESKRRRPVRGIFSATAENFALSLPRKPSALSQSGRDRRRLVARRLQSSTAMRAWESVMSSPCCSRHRQGQGRPTLPWPTCSRGPRRRTEAYVGSAEVAFLTRVRSGEPVAQAAGAATVGQTTDGRIVKVPNGLVHHWRGTIHMPGVGLERVIATAQRYDAYTRIYKSVVEARVLHRDGDRFCVLTRLRGSGGGTTVVLEVRSALRAAGHPRTSRKLWPRSAGRAPAARGPQQRVSVAYQYVHPVRRAGGRRRRGARDDRASRRFPRMLGWLIEPIARRLGQRSVERTLTEFGLAVRDDFSAEPSRPRPVRDPTAAGLTPATPISSGRTSRCDSGSGLG